ncbi:MAG: FKBP-type peptidyl-prolyl cis-trans isomerase [Faecalicoccus sp.]|nr:FKBP-type peptidyl-prolyl cis-trans isomerase [Faecalicoccus sp.]
MRIAVPYDNNTIFQHFGRTESFKIFDVEDNTIISSRVISSNGEGHGALAALLSQYDIDVLICGGIGPGARNALADKHIEVCAGAEGDVDAVVEAYLKGELVSSDESCDHHHHDRHEEGCHGCHDHHEGCGGCHSKPPFEGKNVGKKVEVHYRGTFNDGSEFDASYDRGEPLEFICGAGQMILGFDKAVADMEVGETKNVHLMPEEAYGYPNPQAIVTIRIQDMPGCEDLNVGERVMLRDEMGHRFVSLVTAKDENTITFDTNHEMAGKELNFEITLVSVE